MKPTRYFWNNDLILSQQYRFDSALAPASRNSRQQLDLVQAFPPVEINHSGLPTRIKAPQKNGFAFLFFISSLASLRASALDFPSAHRV